MVYLPESCTGVIPVLINGFNPSQQSFVEKYPMSDTCLDAEIVYTKCYGNNDKEALRIALE